MTIDKLVRLVTATALFLVVSPPAAAQSLNWVHQSTGIVAPTDSVAIGFTGPWVNVFYQQAVGQNIEIRGIRQFPAANPTNNTHYVPYPAPLATFPDNVEVELQVSSRPFGNPTPLPDFALLARSGSYQSPSQLLLINAETADPYPVIRDVEAVAFRPNGELVTFHANDLPQPVDGLVGAGATDLDVALVDTQLNPQNQTYEIRYHQTAFGTRVFLPPVVLASDMDLNPYMVSFTMTAAGIPHVIFTDPGTRQIIAREFDPKVNHWTTNELYNLDTGSIGWTQVASRGEVVAATWAGANPNNPNANDLYVAQKIKEWEVSVVCMACVGNREQIDITFGPDGFPVIAYVSPTNQLMVAYDPLSPEPALPGDVNLDGVVNRTDVALIAINYATAGFSIDPTTDLDGDGQVAVADLSLLQGQFGQYIAEPSPVTVPEPATLWLLVAMVAGIALTKYRNRPRAVNGPTPNASSGSARSARD